VRDDSNVLRAVPFLALLVLVACSDRDPLPPQSPPDAELHTVVFGSGAERPALEVEVADTEQEHAQGLMGVDRLATDRGMAFVFEAPTETSFWMKDTLIPLSIAFVDDEGSIVTIREMTPCEADPCPTYEAAEPFVLAIEANEGWFEANGVRVGDEARLDMAPG
jgi:hypothetical protein